MAAKGQTVSIDRSKSGYIPSLDGWRAVAILCVLIAHDKAMSLLGLSTSRYPSWGKSGVYLFFAISGFLITSRILEEEKVRGFFDIRRFYIRRFFRIQPAALVFLGAIALLIVAGVYHDPWSRWFAALFLFINNIDHGHVPPSVVGHFWSLSVEEHFYILLSLTLLLFKKRRILVLSVLYFIFWLPVHWSYPKDVWYRPELSPLMTQWNLYLLLLASLVAAVMQEGWATQFAERFLRPWVMLLVTLVSLPIHHFLWGGGAEVFVAAYLSVFWVVSTAYHPESMTTRLLETVPFRFVGRISYSLYLWHIVFFGIHELDVAPTSLVAQALSFRAVRWGCSFGIAILSFYYVEKPMIRLGHRLAAPATEGHADLGASLPGEPIVANAI